MKKQNETASSTEWVKTLKTYKIVYRLYPDAENIEMLIKAKSYEDACIFAKGYRKDGFSCDEVE